MIYNMKCKPLYSYNFVNRGININLINRKYSTICNENIGDNELEINTDKVELQKKEAQMEDKEQIKKIKQRHAMIAANLPQMNEPKEHHPYIYISNWKLLIDS